VPIEPSETLRAQTLATEDLPLDVPPVAVKARPGLGRTKPDDSSRMPCTVHIHLPDVTDVCAPEIVGQLP
jgi:hypothetical protein